MSTYKLGYLGWTMSSPARSWVLSSLENLTPVHAELNQGGYWHFWQVHLFRAKVRKKLIYRYYHLFPQMTLPNGRLWFFITVIYWLKTLKTNLKCIPDFSAEFLNFAIVRIFQMIFALISILQTTYKKDDFTKPINVVTTTFIWCLCTAAICR